MSRTVRLSACVLAAVLSLSAPSWAAEGHSHGAAAGHLSELTLNAGAKWQTDAPLRQGMDAIRHEMAAALPDIHHGRQSPEAFRGLAEKVHHQVEFMLTNCKLPPETDAQLHLVLERVLAGAEAMKDGPDRTAGAVTVVGALSAYGAHFEHPGWKALEH